MRFSPAEFSAPVVGPFEVDLELAEAGLTPHDAERLADLAHAANVKGRTLEREPARPSPVSSDSLA